MDTEMTGFIQKNLDTLLPLAVNNGLNLLGALTILLIGIWASHWASQLVIRALSHARNFDEMLKGFFSSIVRYAVLTLTALAVLSQFGVQTASLITVIGAAGLAIGLALQGTLSQVAAGVMLLILRPFKVGHYVEVGSIAGTVKELSLFTTELATSDNIRITVPNSQVWGQPIRNYSYYPQRRADMIFSISYGDNIDIAMNIIQEAISADPRCLHPPAPFTAVNALGQSSVDLVVRVWTANADFAQVKFDLTKAVKEKFDAAGITIPYPSQTVYNGDPVTPQ